MIECFIVFSEVIAFVCVGSQFAAVRTLWPSHRTIGADAGLARATEVGEASIARFATPTSRRGITEGWELYGPSAKPEWWLDSQPERLPSSDSNSQAAAHAGRRELPLSCGTGEPPQCWIPRHSYHPAAREPGQATGPPEAGLVGAARLLAGLLLHHVRSRDRSATALQASGHRSPGPASAPTPDARSVTMLGSERSLKIAQSTLSDPSLAPIETLLAELARRRLRSLAAKKRAG
jgi:hypothetical protein